METKNINVKRIDKIRTDVWIIVITGKIKEDKRLPVFRMIPETVSLLFLLWWEEYGWFRETLKTLIPKKAMIS